LKIKFNSSLQKAFPIFVRQWALLFIRPKCRPKGKITMHQCNASGGGGYGAMLFTKKTRLNNFKNPTLSYNFNFNFIDRKLTGNLFISTRDRTVPLVEKVNRLIGTEPKDRPQNSLEFEKISQKSR
jgi:hypothetical protein